MKLAFLGGTGTVARSRYLLGLGETMVDGTASGSLGQFVGLVGGGWLFARLSDDMLLIAGVFMIVPMTLALTVARPHEIASSKRRASFRVPPVA